MGSSRKKRKNPKETAKNNGSRRKGVFRQDNSSSSSDTSTGVCPDLDCVLNAAQAIKIERDQIINFLKQKSRLEAQLKITGKKLEKKGSFAIDAASLKSALGGDLDNATCGASSETSASSSK